MPKATREPPLMITDLDPGVERLLYTSSVSSAALTQSPARQIEHLLRYIEACPTGKHNRDVAERIEKALSHLRAGERSRYHARYRRARDPYMPPIERTPRLPD